MFFSGKKVLCATYFENKDNAKEVVYNIANENE